MAALDVSADELEAFEPHAATPIAISAARVSKSPRIGLRDFVVVTLSQLWVESPLAIEDAGAVPRIPGARERRLPGVPRPAGGPRGKEYA